MSKVSVNLKDDSCHMLPPNPLYVFFLGWVATCIMLHPFQWGLGLARTDLPVSSTACLAESCHWIHWLGRFGSDSSGNGGNGLQHATALNGTCNGQDGGLRIAPASACPHWIQVSKWYQKQVQKMSENDWSNNPNIFLNNSINRIISIFWHIFIYFLGLWDIQSVDSHTARVECLECHWVPRSCRGNVSCASFQEVRTEGGLLESEDGHGRCMPWCRCCHG